MELWFSDYHTEDVKLDIKIEKQLFGANSVALSAVTVP